MRTRIQKWGNSLALRIPKALAGVLKLHEHSAIEVTVRGGKLIVVAIEERQLTLEDLVGKITPHNCHAEVETGKAVGNEVW